MESELKYIVPYYKLHAVIDFVRSVCRVDKEHPSAIISSIYFDSQKMHSLDEKINSDYYKSKYRLRWYRNCADNQLSKTAYMEVKNRIGSQRTKARVRCDLTPTVLDEISLDDTRLLAIPKKLCTIGIPLQHHLFPALIIQYKRNRFVEPMSNSRISIDSDITVPRYNHQIMPNATVSTLQNVVIEVKGEGVEMVQTLRPLMRFGVRRSSFSKYLSCLAKSHHMTFDPR